ncbi:MAG: hypothetical protein A2921_03655 [Candidatus Magasanikbacteria bacterium RIFCSPLOWO2_01_FULL_43_20b]|uniref:Uncharacterized protein n=1 Tax=Candidatus Magasanikbacteria bacterium RIFCSPLOWO2_12_FULL_43_12 TaxID=1798692 RepID=A0A1F6MS04_9BACT|nr:MAG: hypothetical protein A3C74_02445 [Candidatus Magasanikbacteria bacterium RIFCSPHIGHO2_02_FULL_44_13]OGH72695.1 MAG: hypothetical protein A3I93_03235 [Candidatus Magasanikbacteria bacterium RIFCSPLOWO2_02_FULL_43_22]OGH73557.1 MAG: hypothetical protein A2921_03655 [Candidatus Magasanikbacteria bacterium RIFCSPLOWO2_01_FULL_43_20b]OGH74444.1 MAG: hypothetical protein A3G00_00750 [Candidatus Magasanikbacteria bacterium RIFCSPLOWO2_12_FULL_43_12]
MPDILEIHEFFAEGQNQDRSHVLLHITEPGTPEEFKKGYFFAVAEVNNGPIEQIEHLQKMIDDLESGYYETDNQTDKDPFETVLEYVNRRGHHILQYKNSLLHCMVGVLRGHEISFAYHGQPEVTLFYKNQELAELADMDVLAEQNQVRGDTLFSSVMQGTINYGDYFYIATPRVADFFKSDRIKKILLSRNTRQAAGHIQKVLSDLRQESSFGGILIHFASKYDMPKTGRVPRSANSATGSLNQLANQEQSAEEMLAAPFWGGLKKRWNKFRANRSADKKQKVITKAKQDVERREKGKMETNWRPHETQTSIFNTLLVTIGKMIVIGLTGLFRLIKSIVFNAAEITIALVLIISNKDNKRADVLKTFRRWRETKKESFAALPLLSKTLLILTIVLATVFIGSISVYKIKENLEARRQAYKNQIQAVIDKKNAAEASLVYGDETRALSLFQEAKQAISNLPESNKKQKEEITGLNEQIAASLMKIQKLYTVHPEILLDITSANPTAQTQRLALLGDSLFAYGPEDNNYYQYNLAEKITEGKNYGNNLQLHAASTPKEQDMIVFIAGDSGAAVYNKETTLLSAKDISYPVDNVKIIDTFVYNRKVYTLDRANGEIFKHSQTQTGFDKGVAWLKDEGVDLKDAVSLAIDGDMFVLKQNGEILKLVAGKKEEFAISGLEPKLDKPLAIWTYNNLANIYLLEPTNKRVVILDKTGKLVGQYTAVEWQNPTGMIVDETKKTIYILDSNKIYKFNF